MYDDDFLSALGAWQRGWNEDQARRLVITDALLKAIATRPSDLPRSASQGTLYRKRFLVPNNPQNGGDFRKLIGLSVDRRLRPFLRKAASGCVEEAAEFIEENALRIGGRLRAPRG